MKSQVLEIEVDSDLNGALHFAPLKRRLRGRYDVHRAVKTDRGAASLFQEWPEPIPGQRLALDAEARQAKLIEPLHEERYSAIAAKVKKFARLEPSEQVFSAVDVPTFQYWIIRAVEAGLAKVVAGKLPDKPDGEPKLKLPPKDQAEALAEALNRQSTAIEKLVDAFANANKR